MGWCNETVCNYVYLQYLLRDIYIRLEFILQDIEEFSYLLIFVRNPLKINISKHYYIALPRNLIASNGNLLTSYYIN